LGNRHRLTVEAPAASVYRPFEGLVAHESSGAGIMSAEDDRPQVVPLENSERAVRRFLRRLGGSEALAV
jgi:hypothetical protein